MERCSSPPALFVLLGAGADSDWSASSRDKPRAGRPLLAKCAGKRTGLALGCSEATLAGTLSPYSVGKKKNHTHTRMAMSELSLSHQDDIAGSIAQ